MKFRMIAVAAALAVVAVVAVRAADLSKAACPVSGRDVVESAAVDYKDGKVYFCCERCPGAFAANKDKFAAKANVQLVATGQYEQNACPITGRGLDEETGVEVAGVTVTFCCNRCKARVEGSSEEDQLKLVFSDEAFEKGGFAPKQDEEPESDDDQ